MSKEMTFKVTLSTQSGCPSRSTEWDLPDQMFRFIEKRLEILNEDIHAELVRVKAKELERDIKKTSPDLEKIFMENFSGLLA